MPADDRLASLKIDRPEPGRRALWPWLLLLVPLVTLAVGGPWYFVSGARVPEVQTAAVREVRLDASSTVLNASGYVVARRQATVSSKVTGRVLEVLIEEGMVVRAGQLLARLDDANSRVNLQLAEAEVGATRSQLEETRVRRREAERELERRSRLLERAIISEAELDAARAEVDSLTARLAQQAEQVKVSEARVALWQQELADRQIRAPFAGVVVTKNAQPGEMISPVSAGGGFTRTGIGTIVDMDSLEIEVDVNESYINRVSAGQPVEAVLDAYADWNIPAEVIAIVPTADRQRATVKVRIGFRELDARILPDMGVKVAFRDAEPEAEERRVLEIPRAALRQLNGEEIVLVLDGETVRVRRVTLGDIRADTARVESGLSAGERVVVEGPDELADGDRVRRAEQ
jgi:RND family efflux transporter MFP subunit